MRNKINREAKDPLLTKTFNLGPGIKHLSTAVIPLLLVSWATCYFIISQSKSSVIATDSFFWKMMLIGIVLPPILAFIIVGLSKHQLVFLGLKKQVCEHRNYILYKKKRCFASSEISSFYIDFLRSSIRRPDNSRFSIHSWAHRTLPIGQRAIEIDLVLILRNKRLRRIKISELKNNEILELCNLLTKEYGIKELVKKKK